MDYTTLAFATLPLSIQLGMGVGFLSYVTAYAGRRRGHNAIDAVLLSMVFGLPALLPMASATGATLINAACGTSLAFGMALLWRGKLQSVWHQAARNMGLHAEDGMAHGWDAIASFPKLATGQVSVHTADGRILYLNDRRLFSGSPFKGLYLGSDGSIIMAVEEERMPDGTEQTRQDIVDPDWGTRMTYIPSDQIRRVNIRF